MGSTTDLFEEIDESLSAALAETDDDEARYHIRSAAQRIVIAEESVASDDGQP